MLVLFLIVCIVASTLVTVGPVFAEDESHQAIRTDAVSDDNSDNPTDIEITDEELCECTPGNGSRKPGPIQQWLWNNDWSDSPPVENAIATCVNQYWMEYTAQPNNFVIWQFATEEEAQNRFEIERDAQDQWFSTGWEWKPERTSSELDLGDEAQHWSLGGAKTIVLARSGQFVLFGVAANLGTELADLDDDGWREHYEVYEIIESRFAETLDTIDALLSGQ